MHRTHFRLAFCFAAGLAGALAHAPFDLAPAILIPLIAMAWAAAQPRAALMGWATGLGYFALTLSWITEPFQVDAAATGWMAPFALALMAAGLALFWAAALGLARWLGGGGVTFALAFTATELTRAYLFTGFPWATPPQALVDGLAGQGLAWLGPHGMTLVMAGAAAGAVNIRPRLVRPALLALCVAAMLAPVPYGPATLTGTTIRLVQPNAPQDEKWDPQRIPVFVNRQIAAAAASPLPDVTVLPETALPYLMRHAGPVFDALAAPGVPVVLGIQRRDGRDYYNSLAVLDASGAVTQIYDKHHLVPFGEFMPFPAVFRSLGIAALAQRAEGGYASGPGPALIDLGPGIGTALPLICYETVFAHNMRGTARPAVLLNLTNDAWFGARSGPQQHLAQARMRAIEQGLPILRSANTGISAAIDPYGRVLSSLPLNTEGFLDADLPAPLAPTLYARTGDLPALLIVLLALGASIARRISVDAARRRA
ncbi:MAG: apolipoprotein N-acyltransferase [Pseudomonadota bacterium]